MSIRSHVCGHPATRQALATSKKLQPAPKLRRETEAQKTGRFSHVQNPANKKAKPSRQLSLEGFWEPSVRVGGGPGGCVQSEPVPELEQEEKHIRSEEGARGGKKEKKGGRSPTQPPEGGVSRETSGPVVGYVCPECGALSDLTEDGEPCGPHGRPWDRVSTSLYGFRFRCYSCSEPSFIGGVV